MSRYKPGTPDAYIEVHETLKQRYGPASDLVCPCGKPAQEWAYQFTGEQELRDADGRRPHSTDPADYAAMCRSCHVRFDLEHDPVFAKTMRATLTQNNRDFSERCKSDPALREEMRERGETVGTLRSERMKADPEFAEQMREGSRRGAIALAERMKTHPALAERLSTARRTNALRRRRCLECKFVSSAGGIGNHHRSSGHTGWEKVDG